MRWVARNRDSPLSPTPLDHVKSKPASIISFLLRRPRLAIAGLSLLTVPQLAGQTVSPATAGRSNETAVELSPFIVLEDTDEGYEAKNTAGVTGTNRSIRSLPISMDVATSTFLSEINARNLIDAIELMPNVAMTNTEATNGGSSDQNSFRLRGMTSKEERRRNGVMSLAIPDPFSTDRIEFLRGAQALLYGQGIASGAINVVTKRALFGSNRREVTLTGDSDESYRATLDLNLARSNLALRVAAVEADKHFWQDNLSDKTRGIYADIAYRINRSLVARVNHEQTKGKSALRGGVMTIRDNSLADPRNNAMLDRLLYENGDVSGIIIGGSTASYENYRSPASIAAGRESKSKVTNVALEGTFGSNLSARVAYSHERMFYYNKANGASDLLAPGDNRAVNNQWSFRVDPTRSDIRWYIETLQGTVRHQGKVGNFLKSELIAGTEYRFKRQTIERQRLYAVDAGGRFLPGPDALGLRQMQPFTIPISTGLPAAQYSYPGYAWATTHAYGAVAPTPVNPRGLGGVGTPINRPEEQIAGYASWLGNWFGGRLDTMAGVRVDRIELRDQVFGWTDFDSTIESGLVGAVYNIRENFGIYANVGRAFSAIPLSRLQVFDYSLWPIAKGRSREAGFKFDLWRDRISGSVTYFDNENQGEVVTVSGAQLDLFNPAGINGRSNSSATGATMNVGSKGVELALTLRPTKNWRVMLSAGTNDARTINPAKAAMLYNDQFNTDGTTVLVRSANGSTTPLLVPSVRTDANSPRIPLTLAMMRDRNSPYFAQIDPSNGRIINANNLFLNTAGVPTGEEGLPISEHQLGFQAPNGGIAEVVSPGDYLTAIAGRSLLLNTTYFFATGPLEGFSVGGLVSWQGDRRAGYATIGGVRQLYYAPDLVRSDLRLGYHWKLGSGRQLSLRLTVSNVLDQMEIRPTLNVANGTVTSVTPDLAPRTWVLSSTLRF
jgi:outer membrane receptor protein involved in Fe transport